MIFPCSLPCPSSWNHPQSQFHVPVSGNHPTYRVLLDVFRLRQGCITLHALFVVMHLCKPCHCQRRRIHYWNHFDHVHPYATWLHVSQYQASGGKGSVQRRLLLIEYHNVSWSCHVRNITLGLGTFPCMKLEFVKLRCAAICLPIVHQDWSQFL